MKDFRVKNVRAKDRPPRHCVLHRALVHCTSVRTVILLSSLSSTRRTDTRSVWQRGVSWSDLSRSAGQFFRACTVSRPSIVVFTLDVVSPDRWHIWLSFFFFLRCAIHDAAAHLNRFAIIRVMLASKMVGATPQLPPCCIAAGCSPATEICKSALVHLSFLFYTFIILFNNLYYSSFMIFDAWVCIHILNIHKVILIYNIFNKYIHINI